MADNWYSEKDLPDPPAPLKLNAWNDLQFTRWVPTWDGDVLLELYVYLRVKIKANYPHGQIQVQVMRENTEPPDAAAPNDLTVGRRNQTLAQMSSTSPEFGRPIKQLWYGACTPEEPDIDTSLSPPCGSSVVHRHAATACRLAPEGALAPRAISLRRLNLPSSFTREGNHHDTVRRS